MKDKSAFPHDLLLKNKEGYAIGEGELGMTFGEWQWTQFAAAALQAHGPEPFEDPWDHCDNVQIVP